MLSILRPGDEVVANADLYGGTYRLLERVYRPWGLVTHYADDASPEGFAKLITSKTKLVWIETPTNPLLQLVDIAAVAEVAHRARGDPRRRQHVRLALPPAAVATRGRPRRPQHDEVPRRALATSSAGAVVGRAELVGPIAFYQNAAGGVPGPFDAYLTLRGLKTLELRMQKHCANAEAPRRLARRAAAGRDTSTTPACTNHPQHALAKRQMRDFGGMVSLRLKGGAEAARKFLARRACSASPRAWAGSSRWSATPRR